MFCLFPSFFFLFFRYILYFLPFLRSFMTPQLPIAIHSSSLTRYFPAHVSDAEDDPDRSLFGNMCDDPRHFPSGWTRVVTMGDMLLEVRSRSIDTTRALKWLRILSGCIQAL